MTGSVCYVGKEKLKQDNMVQQFEIKYTFVVNLVIATSSIHILI